MGSLVLVQGKKGGGSQEAGKMLDRRQFGNDAGA